MKRFFIPLSFIDVSNLMKGCSLVMVGFFILFPDSKSYDSYFMTFWSSSFSNDGCHFDIYIIIIINTCKLFNTPDLHQMYFLHVLLNDNAMYSVVSYTIWSCNNGTYSSVVEVVDCFCHFEFLLCFQLTHSHQ